MRKKKMRNKLFIWIALLTFMLGVNSESVFAAETTQNGVIVETTFDKSSYQNEEKAIYSVYIQNTNSEIINIKDINFDIPDGYKLSEETAKESIQNIQPGEHVLLKYDIDEKSTNNGSDNDNGNTKGDISSDDNNGNTKGDTPSGDNRDNSSRGNNKGNSIKNNKETTNKSETKQVATGDNAKIILWTAIMVIALIIILIVVFQMKNKKGILSLLLIMATLTEIMLSPVSVKAEDNPNRITLSDKFVVNDVEKTVSVHIDIEKINGDYEEDTTTYTRGEWIQEIVNTYGLSANLSEASETKFTDIEGTKYQDAIRIAEIYGIVDEGELFFPNEFVTREFAAVTAVRVLGYQGSGIPECEDSDGIQNKSEVYLALKSGMLLLKSGCFEPQSLLDRTDGKLILEHIVKIVKSTEVDLNKNTGYVYKEGIICLEDNVEYTDDGKFIVLAKNKQTENLQCGQIFIIEDTYAYKIVNIEKENDLIKIEYESPELTEFISSMSLCGETKDIDWTKIKLAEGVTIEDSENDISTMSLENDEKIETYSDETIVPIQVPGKGKLKYTIADKYELSFNFHDLYGKYVIDIDQDSLRCNNVYVSVGVDSDVYLKPKDSESKKNIQEIKINKEQKVHLFDFNIVGPIVVGVDAVVGVDGYVSLKTTWNYEYGFGVINNIPRKIFQYKNTGVNLNASASAYVGVKGEILLELFTKKLVSFAATPKLNFSAVGNVYLSNPRSCIDISALYLTVDISALEDCVLGDLLKVKWSYTFGTPKTSIFCWRDIHIEISENNGELQYDKVKVCTRKPKDYSLQFCVTDTLTGVPLDGAEIAIGDKKYMTNADGFTEVINGKGNLLDVVIQKDNYISKKIEVVPSEYTEGLVKVKLTAIPDGAEEYNGHYYKIYHGSYAWDIAKEKCEAEGGYLATITTEEEQQFINKLNSSNDRLWIGGTRNQQYLWSWVTEEVWMYENWAPGEPNNSPNVVSNENCVAIWNSSGQWNDLNNNNTYEQNGFICEWE